MNPFALARVALLAVSVSAAAADPFRTFKDGHRGTVSCLAYSADGALVASGAKDGLVVLWDTVSGKAVARIDGHKDMVVAVAISPDGKTLASTDHTGEVRLSAVA